MKNTAARSSELNSAAKAAGNNLQLLLFTLSDQQRYGINVFKVREIITRPEITRVHNGHPAVLGIFSIRQQTLPLVDMATVIGRASGDDNPNGTVIITEYNQQSLAFLVNAVDRIVYVGWEAIVPPPRGIGNDSFLTSVVKSEETLIEILDVERIMWTVLGMPKEVSDDVTEAARMIGTADHLIAAVDDSQVARSMMAKVFDSIGVEYVLFESGAQAYDTLTAWASAGDPRLKKLSMLVSDVEMPEMDGPTLVDKLRAQAEFKQLYIVLHSSIEQRYYQDRMGASEINAFITKFDPDSLGTSVLTALETRAQRGVG